MKIVLISGTNRPGSQTRRLTKYIESQLQSLMTAGESLELLDLVDLPLEVFAPTSYQTKPESFAKFSSAMIASHAMFFVIPEYNDGAPGVLKYFVDMLPFPQSLQHRATGLVGVAAGRFGNLRGVEQIEGVLKYRNAYVYPERTFIPFVDKALDESGEPKDEGTLKVLNSQILGFLEFARKTQSK